MLQSYHLSVGCFYQSVGCFVTCTSLYFADDSVVFVWAFRPVLAKVKEKTPISLPGWEATDRMVVEETPISQMTQVNFSRVFLC